MKYLFFIAFFLFNFQLNAQQGSKKANQFYQQGLQLHQNGQIQQAVEFYGKALQKDPYHLKSLYNRGIAYLKAGHFTAAQQDFTAIIQVTPNDQEVLEHLANTKFYLQDYSNAVKIYDRLIYLNPKDNLYSNRGLAKSKMKEYDAALEDLNKAILQNPHDEDYYAHQGDIYTATDQYDLAINSYDKAVNLNSYDAYVYNNRGNAKSKIQDHTAAIVDYNTAIMIQAESDFYTNRALSMLQLNRYEEAITDSKKALSIDPTNANAYYNLGLAKLRSQQFAEAVLFFNEAIHINGNDAEYFADRATAKYYLGDYRGAIIDCENVLALDTKAFYILQVLEAAQQAIDYTPATTQEKTIWNAPSTTKDHLLEYNYYQKNTPTIPRTRRINYQYEQENEDFDLKYLDF